VVNGERISQNTPSLLPVRSPRRLEESRPLLRSPGKGNDFALRRLHKLSACYGREDFIWSRRNDGRILCGATVEHVGFDKAVTAGGGMPI
jgi:hypothetical protein